MSRPEPRWDERPDGSVWISHWTLKRSEIAALAAVRELTVWNVKGPPGFTFAELAHLEFLDIRGGSKPDLSELIDCGSLRGLVVNQVRGLIDVSAISSLERLRILSLYGLSRVESLPDLSRLAALERLELGQMRSLTDWRGLTTAPGLREVFFSNLLQPDLEVIDRLATQPALRGFSWSAPDVPVSVQAPVRDRLARLGACRIVRPEQWLREASAE